MTELEIASWVAAVVSATYNVPYADVFAAGHDHEELPEGSASVAYEGGPYEWAITWPDTPQAQAAAAQLGVWFEPINNCILAIHPNREDY